ncbi:MAG: MFS transporter [Propionibacteriaceae bacterium]|jgi:MFS family permease|nr:MFS transporter [Propionibacteriaceae bacterium]
MSIRFPRRNTDPDSVPMFASLYIRNYRLYFWGGLVSNTGTWMARVAQDWLVLTILTKGDSLSLGVTTALQFLPVVLLAGQAGAAADRYDKRKLLQVTQTCMLTTGLALAIPVLLNATAVPLWYVFILSFLTGIAAAFDAPARQAYAPEMVPTKLIPNAVGLNTTSFNAARLIGPALSGMMIAWWGVGWSLLINAVSFVPVIVALALQRPGELHPAKKMASHKGALRDGLRYVRKRPRIVLLLFTIFMLGTFGMNFQITNALMATEEFHLASDGYGFMGTIMAIGSLSAGLWAAKRSKPRMRLIMIAMAGFGVAVTGLTFAPNVVVYSLFLIPAGLFSLTVMTACNASVQLAVEPEMRGRVMALYMAIFMGGTPLGAPVLGWVGEVLGARWTLAVGCVSAFITVAVVVGYVARSKDFDWPHKAKTDDPSFDYLNQSETELQCR